MTDEEQAKRKAFAEEAGKLLARSIFKARGNHSEAHLREADLALICETAVDIGINFADRRNK